MLIKRILCEVKENQCQAFSEYQAQWKGLEDIPGFLGQIGGWNKKQPMNASIYTFWKDQESYAYFMENVHDEIFNPGQANTYSSIKIEMFEEEFYIEGLESDIESVLKKSQFFRVAICEVKEGRANNFLDTQRNVWNQGMKQTKTMLGGEVAFAVKDKNRFLIFSGWQNEKAHEQYVQLYFPSLKEMAQMELDLENINGEAFIVEKAWSVLPFHIR
ncbi:DUF4937 domain-containing protein [Heyndrickxia sporothermodurans]